LSLGIASAATSFDDHIEVHSSASAKPIHKVLRVSVSACERCHRTHGFSISGLVGVATNATARHGGLDHQDFDYSSIALKRRHAEHDAGGDKEAVQHDGFEFHGGSPWIRECGFQGLLSKARAICIDR
jgi:hypothetical protein